MKTVIIVLAVVIALLFICFGIGYAFVFLIIRRQGTLQSPETGAESSELLEPTGNALWAYNIPKFKPFRELPFESADIISFDGLRLHADFLRGEPGTKVTMIFCHGYKSEAAFDFAAMYDFYRSLGYNLVYLNMRAHGKSEGKYIGFGALDRFDVQMWTKKIAELFPDTSIFLHGMSMGAASILQSADLELDPAVCGIIADCGFSSTNEVFRNLVSGLYHLPATPFVDIFEAVNRITAGYGFSDADSVRSMEKSRLPLAYICGDCDRYVPLDMAMRIYNACVQDKVLLIAKGAGHAASFMTENEKYRNLITEFINTHRKEDE
ncbi:MAG: alpha/beta hydrolase [Oscillospiraceae bacterium]|nr:alpha/beta hydrolase [Oscillospiraceae bacterium]